MHDSYGSSGTSPQGLVASMRPSDGSGLSRPMRSVNSRPGSPPAHAAAQIRSNSSAAGRLATTRPVRGLTSECRPPRVTALMNRLVTATDRLKYSRPPAR